MEPLNVLLVPGGEPPGAHREAWEQAVRRAAASVRPDADVRFLVLDVAGRLRAGGRATRPLEPAAPGRTEGVLRARAASDPAAGAWVERADLRREARSALREALAAHDARVVVASGAGGLVAYEALASDARLTAGRGLLTLDVPLAHPRVCREVFGGRLAVPAGCPVWRHVCDRSDPLAGPPPRLHDARFRALEAQEAQGLPYRLSPRLDDAATVGLAWPELLANLDAQGPELEPAPPRRALLVGIDEYPDPRMRLRGCLNDVYAVSALLQEVGYPAEDIRVVVDRRATTRAILERLDWLVDGLRGGEERFLYFSGHGAQIPVYGAGERVDGVDEVLVPHDFDWSLERAVTDDDLGRFYRQLPYDARLYAVFDCCHAGGLARDGIGAVRGLEAPPDVRHRALTWDAAHGLWVPRRLGSGSPLPELRRLGASTAFRPPVRERYLEARASLGHRGPFRPTLIFACEEGQRARELDQGTAVHGAFTFCFTRAVRAALRSDAAVSVVELCEQVADDLARIGHPQPPVVEGPTERLREPLPWKARAG